MGIVTKFRRKPSELNHNVNPYMPSLKVIKRFCLPEGVGIQNLEALASTIDLETIGVTIPRCKYPERFEAGFRYGLAHNRRTDVKTQFRVLFSTGFCWAKMFYKKFAPKHRLASPGSYKMKIELGGDITKTKDH